MNSSFPNSSHNTPTAPWLSLDDNRLTRFLGDGKVIAVKPKNMDAVVPIFCPLCEFPNRTSDDSSAFREGGVCYACDIRWRRPYLDRWNNEGWRPSGQEWQAYLDNRELLSKPGISFS